MSIDKTVVPIVIIAAGAPVHLLAFASWTIEGGRRYAVM